MIKVAKYRWSNISKQQKLTLVILAFAVIGVIMTFIVKGAPGMLTVEPESGQQSGNAEVINDSTASGGKALLFKSVPASPPPPSGGYTCTDTNVTPSNFASKIAAAGPGTVLCLDAGNYGAASVVFENKHGQADSPIVVQPKPGLSVRPVFEVASSGSRSIGLWFINSSHIVVKGMEIRRPRYNAVTIYGSNNIVLENNYIHSFGIINPDSAGIKISKYNHFINNRATIRPEDPISHNITIRGNTLVGIPGSYSSGYNEGIYIGTSTSSNSNPDHTHTILIENNEISYVGGEAVDSKPGVSKVTVRNNYFHDIYLRDSAAITIARNGDMNYPNGGEFVVEGNKIQRVQPSGHGNSDGMGISIGVGNALIKNNIICNTTKPAISLWQSFHLSPSHRTVTISGNSFFSNGGGTITVSGGSGSGPSIVNDGTNKTVGSCPI